MGEQKWYKKHITSLSFHPSITTLRIQGVAIETYVYIYATRITVMYMYIKSKHGLCTVYLHNVDFIRDKQTLNRLNTDLLG